MENVIAEELADCKWGRTVSIRGHSHWNMTDRLEGLLEKVLGGVHGSLLTQHRVNEVAVLINGSIQRAPRSLDYHIGFINMPGGLSPTTSLCAQLLCDQGSKTLLPISNRLVSECKTAFQEQVWPQSQNRSHFHSSVSNSIIREPIIEMVSSTFLTPVH